MSQAQALWPVIFADRFDKPVRRDTFLITAAGAVWRLADHTSDPGDSVAALRKHLFKYLQNPVIQLL